MARTDKEVCANSLCYLTSRFLTDLMQGIVSDTEISKELGKRDIELATEEVEANEQLLDSSNFDVCTIHSTSFRFKD
jgi:hypothetical protein